MANTQANVMPFRYPSIAKVPAVLDTIFQEDINIAIWERTLDAQLKEAVSALLTAMPRVKLKITVSPDNTEAAVLASTKGAAPAVFVSDIVMLVDQFCELFNIDEAVLSLETLDHAMCPRFHVDWVPCRLVTSYNSVATEWLANHSVDRSKLGAKSNGVPDALSGLYQQVEDIQQLSYGSVALLKGDRWPDNEGAGLVHRSPNIPQGDNRLLLTLNMVD